MGIFLVMKTFLRWQNVTALHAIVVHVDDALLASANVLVVGVALI